MTGFGAQRYWKCQYEKILAETKSSDMLSFVFFLSYTIIDGCFYKCHEYGVGIRHGTFEFGMELYSDKPWMSFQFNNLDKIIFFIYSNRYKSCFLILVKVSVIEFIAVAMPLGDVIHLVNLMNF